MHSTIFFDGAIRQLSAAKISAVSSAALYGRGVFTTIAVNRGQPFLWHLHERRLRDHAARINLDLTDFSFDNLSNALSELISINGVKTGRARITLFEAGSSRLWQTGEDESVKTLISTVEPSQTKEDLRLTVSPFTINTASPLAGVKSCNYLEKIIALETIRRQGFDEALSANERGEIAGATMANVFWVKSDKIFTPALAIGALAGTTREYIIELARNKGFSIEETIAQIDEIQTAEEIFLTSAGIGVCLAKQINEKSLAKNISAELHLAYAESLF